MNIKLIYEDKTYQFDISKDVTIKYIEYLSSKIFRISQHKIELIYNNEKINKNDQNSLLIDYINNNEKYITIIVEINNNINNNNNFNNDNQSQCTFDSNNINFYKIDIDDINGNQKIKKEQQYNYLKNKFYKLDAIIIKEKNFGKKFGIIFEKIFNLYENALIQFKNNILKAEKCFSFFFDYSLYNKTKKLFINNLTADKLSAEEILNLNSKIENINGNIKYIQTQKNFYVNVLNIFKKKINTINQVNNFFNVAVLQFNYIEFMKNLDNVFKILLNDYNNNIKEEFNKTLSNDIISSNIRSRNIMNNNYLFGNTLTLNKTISNRNSINFSNFKTFNNEINNKNNDNSNKLILSLNGKRSIKLKKISKPEIDNLNINKNEINSDNKNINGTENNENVVVKRKMKKKKTGQILNIEKISDTSIKKNNKNSIDRTSNNSIKFKIKKKINEFGEIKIPKLNLHDILDDDKNNNAILTEKKKEEQNEPQIKNNTDRKQSFNSSNISEIQKKNKNLKEENINEGDNNNNNNNINLEKEKNDDKNNEKNDEEKKDENNNNENNNENENNEKEENLENENKEQIINNENKPDENENNNEIKRKKKRVINKYDFII